MNEQTNLRFKLTFTEWLAILSFVMSAGAVIFTGGVMYGQVQRNQEDIRELQPLKEDMAEVKANVGFLVELAREERRK